MSKLVALCHGQIWSRGNLIREATITVRDGYIETVKEGFCPELLEGAGKIMDLKGAVLFPGWIDSHLHIPGSLLFQLYGADLQKGRNTDDYIRILGECRDKDGWIRGFGWNAPVLEKEGYERLTAWLEKQYGKTPVLLFSDDYHSCMCNSCALEKIAWAGIQVEPDCHGIVKEKDIFQLTARLEEMAFPEDQMETAILHYQEKLLDLGITAVQTLMFLGGNGDREWKVLRQLDLEGRLKLKINLALTVQPYEDLAQTELRFARLKEYETEHLRVHTVKIYMDGVLENGTACLIQPYEGTDWRGACVWEQERLRRFCQMVDEAGHQIHIHAIGDGAVRAAADGLIYAMRRNASARKNRHVITHLQVVSREDMDRMGEYGLIGAIQPYWFSQGEESYGMDAMCLGRRTENEYPAESLRRAGMMLTGSSDSPVTPVPDPVSGIRMASERYCQEERVPADEMVKAFTENGAYQLFREHEIGRIEAGYRADLVGYSEAPVGGKNRKGRLCFVMADGKAVRDKLG